jgi:glycerophosphoryl diester phosphodiesterase
MQLSLLGPLDRWLAPAPLARKIGWLGGQSYAHRGLHAAGVPENSPAAFTAAIARGLGIECDVQRSSDGQAMVFHDWDLERLTPDSLARSF